MSIKIGLSFFSAFLHLQSIRDDETTTSKKLIFFNALTDVRKTRVEVANSGKTMTFYVRSELFRKYPKTSVFDHSNYRLFERIPAVPGTSNNRGLTVCLLYTLFSDVILISLVILVLVQKNCRKFCLYVTFLDVTSSCIPSLVPCWKITLPNVAPKPGN